MSSTPSSSTPSQGGKKNAAVVVAIIVLIIAGGAYWMLQGKQSHAPTTTSVSTDTTPVTTSDIENNVAPNPEPVTPPVATPDSTTPSSDTTPSTESATSTKSFTVTGANFSFSPSTINVKKGDKVKVTFVNNEGFHDWVLDEFNVRTPQIGAGKSATVEFTADKTGTFEYYCSVGSHRQMGMKGTLVVE